MRCAPLLALGLLACQGPPASGTSVGNPTKMSLRVALSTDVQLDVAEFPSGELVFTYTNGEWESVELSQIDLLAGAPVELPNGEWESMAFLLDTAFEFSGTTRSGDAANLTIDVPAFRLDPRQGAVLFERGEFVLELASPGWLDEDNAGYDADAEVRVEPGSPIHDGLARAIEDGSALYGDDGDHQIDDAERARGHEAAGGRPR